MDEDVEITEQGLSLREKAVCIPSKIGGCIQLDQNEAIELYKLLHKLLGTMQN